MKSEAKISGSSEVSWVLALSGISGLVYGFAYWDWQWAVEHAQVLAGIVNYSPSSPVAITTAKLWNIIAQLGALLLAAGVSELALSVILSGLIGLLSFQALALVVYALSRDGMLAVGAVFVILVSNATAYGVVYPIKLLDFHWTYGALCLSFVVLAVALLSTGFYRIGAFLLGIAPAVHTVLGLWVILVVGLAAIAAGRDVWPAVRSGFVYFAAGAIVTIGSFTAQKLIVPTIPAVDPAVGKHYFDAFVPFWDVHRAPIDLNSPGVVLNLLTVVLAVAWLVRFRKLLLPSTRFLLRFVAIGGVLSIGLAWWTTLPAEWVPDWFIQSMPGRLLNINIFLAAALLFGLMGSLRPPFVAQTMSLTLAAGLLASTALDLDAIVVLILGFCGMLLAVPVSIWAPRRAISDPARFMPGQTWSLQAPAVLRSALVVVLAVAVGLASFDAIKEFGLRNDDLLDWRTDPVFRKAAARHGELLLAGGALFGMQLRTRRPVLLDGSTLDTLPYALESGPAIDRILADVYGIDLFHPPDEARHKGRIPKNANRAVWEVRPRDRWQQIGREYGVSQVITPRKWKLDLPMVARSSLLNLYEIPP